MTFLNWLIFSFLPQLPLGIAFSFLLNAFLFYFIFHSKRGIKWFSHKRHSKSTPTLQQFVREIKNAIIPEILLGIISTLILTSKNPSPYQTWIKTNWSFHYNELPIIFLECLVVFIAYEIYYFYLHRSMHHPLLFKYFHEKHHQSIQPTPQTGTSVNVLEAISFYSFYVIVLFFPLHFVTLLIVGLNIKIASLSQHWGHEVFPSFFRKSKILKYINSTYFHHLHHSDHFNKNYGFQTSFLDRFYHTVNPKYFTYEKEK